MVIVLRIIHLKEGWPIKVTNKFKFSSRLIVMYLKFTLSLPPPITVFLRPWSIYLLTTKTVIKCLIVTCHISKIFHVFVFKFSIIVKCLGIPQNPKNLGNSPNSLENFCFILGNFSNGKLFGKFFKYLQDIWVISEISSHSENFQNLKNIPPSNFHRNLGNLGKSSNT